MPPLQLLEMEVNPDLRHPFIGRTSQIGYKSRAFHVKFEQNICSYNSPITNGSGFPTDYSPELLGYLCRQPSITVMTEFIQVFTTVNSRDNADKIASKLL